MFKLDLVELALQGVRADVMVDEEGVHVGCASTLAELSRQLRADPRAAGLPDDLEGAIEALLVDRAAMQRAGTEMPAPSTIQLARMGALNGIGTQAIYDLFAPHVARLTQERDEARRMAGAAIAAGERGLAREDALRQRAERAERETVGLRQYLNEARSERDEANAKNATLEHALAEVTAAHGRVFDERDDLRARIAELESRTEPCADVVERLAAIAWDARSIAMCKDRPGAEPVPYAELDEPEKSEECAYARAVISHLAAMGEDAWPTVEDIAILLWNAENKHRAWTTPWEDGGPEAREYTRTLATSYLALLRSRLAPTIGALRAQVAELEQRIAEAVEEEHEACRDIARSIYQGNTEIPVKDTAAWYACAEFIADEMGRRG